jgi:hypothetical protein
LNSVMAAASSHTQESTPEGAPTSSRLMTILRSTRTVFQFEFKRSRTWKRMLVWAGVALFPALIIFLMLWAGDTLPRGGWISAVFVMACEMVVVLNAMLWVAPIVQTELEGKTWLYVVTRPYGRVCLVLGKLLNGLAWTLGAGLLALSLVGAVGWCYALPLSEISGGGQVHETSRRSQQVTGGLVRRQRVPPLYDPSLPGRGPRQGFEFQAGIEHELADFPVPQPGPEPVFASVGEALKVGGTLALLIVLSSLTYSSLFCGIGCIIPSRAMLVAFSYTLIFETIVAFVPAIINRLTIQYHLRCLLNRWIDLEVPEQGKELFFSDWPATWHVAVLAGMIVLWQIVSLTVIHFRQYVMTDEG